MKIGKILSMFSVKNNNFKKVIRVHEFGVSISVLKLNSNRWETILHIERFTKCNT